MIPDRIVSRLAHYGEIEPCWEWQGSLTRGYGTVHYQGRDWYVHRLTYTFLVGEIPKGLEIDHLCRNTVCANPAHLEPVTPAENRRRAGYARTKKTHCKQGHERTPENLTPGRNCKTCMRIRGAARAKNEPIATHCGKGHEFTPENTYRPGGTGKRACRECRSAWKRANRPAKGAATETEPTQGEPE